MVSFDRVYELMQDLADELPKGFFDQLNGGISLSEETRMNPQAKDDDLFTLGEYHHGDALGRRIVLYYGSLMAVYGGYPEELLVAQLRRVLRHEFRHHLESLAGENGLEIEDQKQMEAYLRSKGM